MKFLPKDVPERAETDLLRLGKIVEDRFGLIFSGKRKIDIWRIVFEMATEQGISPFTLLRILADVPPSGELAERLLTHLTVGETYFFRERKTLKTFMEVALPDILSRNKDGSVRIWSAGCSTGEEPYTLSMLLSGVASGSLGRSFSIFGSDINSRALEKARRGLYSAWSFRRLEDSMRNEFFDVCGEGIFSVKERFRKNVSFDFLNLAESQWNLWRDEEGPDVIFCRNVLIYFSPSKREEVLARFHRILPSGGWLVVAPCETSVLLSSRFSPLCHGEATLYRKENTFSPSPLFISYSTVFPEIDENRKDPSVSAMDSNEKLFSVAREDREAETSEFLFFEEEKKEPGNDGLLQSSSPSGESLAAARRLADRGLYEEALREAEKARSEDKMDPAVFYLVSQIRQELGDEKEARAALRNALFLNPEFVMAHYALGNLALKEGKLEQANRHFRNVKNILSEVPSDLVLPEGEGRRAVDLLDAVRSLCMEIKL